MLHATGHGYWTSWGGVAVLAALAGAVLALLSHGWAEVRAVRAHVTMHRRSSVLAMQLAAFQVGAFALTELVERVVAHEPITGAMDRTVLGIGIVAQIVVAAIVVQLLRIVRRAAVALAGRPELRVAAARPSRPRRAPSTLWRGGVWWRPGPSRAPPLPI
ncbi:MAG: hypothetical protein QOD30_1691 [Actinomycetota bacterium]|nr:hypothetical protein [Actinomycetota bacterium]